MTLWKEIYRNQGFNSEISASSTEDFATDNVDLASRNKYGSFNRLIVSNLSDYPIRITLDAETFTEMGAQGIAIIDSDDGISFNLIRITNLDSSNAIPANKVSVRWARAIKV